MARGSSIRVRALLAVILFPLLLLGQSETGRDIRFRLRTSVDLVLVPVTVKNGEGALVTDLTRDDFRVYENGEEQRIRFFSTDPFPLSVVLLLDGTLKKKGKEALLATLPVLSGGLAPDDEFALYTFDTYPRRLLDFTRDTEQLLQALKQLEHEEPRTPGFITGGPMSAGPRVNSVPVGPGVPQTLPQARKSAKAIHDALYEAGMALRERERGRRRVVLILSDGRNSRLNQHSFEETRDLLLAEDISVFAVGVENARFALGTTVLSDYADVTGGDYYAPASRAGLERAHLRVAEQARYQYTLVYHARPTLGTREYRRIDVQVMRPNVSVRAREGYFAGVPDN